MPSELSLARGEYYGNPRNAFWRVAAHLFGARPELAYPDRLAALQLAGVALWDVCAVCRRRGSSDASIRDVIANPILELVRRSPRLRAIACNGTKAHDLLESLVVAPARDGFSGIVIERLPSTSPAHAARSEAQKLAAWRVLLDHAANEA